MHTYIMYMCVRVYTYSYVHRQSTWKPQARAPSLIRDAAAENQTTQADEAMQLRQNQI